MPASAWPAAQVKRVQPGIRVERFRRSLWSRHFDVVRSNNIVALPERSSRSIVLSETFVIRLLVTHGRVREFVAPNASVSGSIVNRHCSRPPLP